MLGAYQVLRKLPGRLFEEMLKNTGRLIRALWYVEMQEVNWKRHFIETFFKTCVFNDDYANLRTSKLLTKITPTLEKFSTFYCRFIDDLFFLFTWSESKLIKFLVNLNKKHHTIKFEFPYSKTSIIFLNTKVYKNENGTLCTTIYGKPSDRRNFVHYKSAHPKALKDSIPYSQGLHIKRTCSETPNSIKHLKDRNPFLNTDRKPMFPFYTLWKHQKSRGFLMFSRSIKRENRQEMG